MNHHRYEVEHVFYHGIEAPYFFHGNIVYSPLLLLDYWLREHHVFQHMWDFQHNSLWEDDDPPVWFFLLLI
uniref:Uncharacterized protein n=1 Tax=Haematobia irritans TaxID=7368 RepID=A0A1L8E704_HAEIR